MEWIKEILMIQVYGPGDWQNLVGRIGAEFHHGKGVQVYKRGEDQPSSGFQKGDEIWEKDCL